MNSIETDILTTFGIDGLQKAELATVADSHIPEESKSFLLRIGVPLHEILGFNFNLLNVLPTLKDFKCPPAGYNNDNEKLYCLGETDGVIIAIDGSEGGSLVLVDTDFDFERTFVNSRIVFLVGGLAQCIRHWQRVRDGWGPDARGSAHLVQEWIVQMDPQALSEEKNYWGPVLEQLGQGLL
jgi:hypothetical protein